MSALHKRMIVVSLAAAGLTLSTSLMAQTPSTALPIDPVVAPTRKQITPEQKAARRKMEADCEAGHADMMHQLGIPSLRPGTDGDKKSPNAANFDDTKVSPYI